MFLKCAFHSHTKVGERDKRPSRGNIKIQYKNQMHRYIIVLAQVARTKRVK